MAYSLNNDVSAQDVVQYTVHQREASHFQTIIGIAIILLIVSISIAVGKIVEKKRKHRLWYPAKAVLLEDLFTHDFSILHHLIIPFFLFPIAVFSILLSIKIGKESFELSHFIRLALSFYVVWMCLARPLVRWVLLPLGLVRAVYFVLKSATLSPKKRDEALLFSAWALLHKKKNKPQSIHFLEQKMSTTKRCKANTLVAYAFLAWAKGDRDLAQKTLRSLDTLHPAAFPVFTKRLVIRWKITEAISRCRWDEVIYLSEQTLGYYQLARFSLRFLETWARWIHAQINQPHPNQQPNKTLVSLRRKAFFFWLFSFHPIRLWPLMRTFYKKDRLPHFQKDHAHPDTYQAFFSRIDQTLSGIHEQKTMMHRAVALSIYDLATLHTAFENDLVKELGRLLISENIPWQHGFFQSSPFLSKIAASAREQVLVDLEQRCAALEFRTESKRPLPVLQEWVEWIEMRSAYTQASLLGGPEVAATAWLEFHRIVCNHAVWLSIGCKEVILANAIFAYLAAEATEQQDASSIEQERRNSSISADKVKNLLSFIKMP